MTRMRLTSLLTALAAVPALAQSMGPRTTEDPCDVPALGFNLVSFANFGSGGELVWRAAIEDLQAHGVCHVSLCPVRFVNPDSGAIASSSKRAPDLSHVAAAANAARSLGMTVTLNPFVEVEEFKFWRGELTLAEGSEVAIRFWRDYRDYLLQTAHVAAVAGVEFMTIGSELRGITGDRGHRHRLKEIIEAVDAVYEGQLGYAANWNEFDTDEVSAAIWNHPAIEFLGIDAYFGLADTAEADASAAHPDRGFVAALAGRWNQLLDNRILPFARERRDRKRLPVVLTEIGFVPYGRTSVAPHQAGRGLERPPDPDEQLNAYQAILDGLQGRARDVLAVYAWHWGMPGAEDSPWFLHPTAVNNRPNSPHDEALGNRTAEFLVRVARDGGCRRTCGPRW